MKINNILALIIIALLILLKPCLAEEGQMLEGIEFLTGYGWGDLKEQKDYHLVPLVVDFDFNFKKITEKIGFNPAIMLQFQVEPFISPIIQPEANVEVGNAFAFKIGLVPETWKVQPYIKMAAGMLYMTQHTYEQGTQFNFIEYGGGGFHWFIKDNVAVTAEYRFRHLSNCGIEEPNSGINTSFGLIGLYYKF